MSNPPDSPLFYTLTATNCYDCSTSVIGIFDSMRAIGYRLQRIHSTCGDEYHIDCYHLSTAVKENDELIEQLSNRAKYQREEAIKDQLLKEHQEKSSNDDEDLAEQLREQRLNIA
jgi:cobalamin biosynthesis Mg chelatase CobN